MISAALLIVPLLATLLGEPANPGAIPAGDLSAKSLPARSEPTLSPSQMQLLERCAEAFKEGRYEECLSELDRAFPANHDHPAVLNLRGASLSELGRHTGAMLYFMRLLEQKPDDFWAAYNLAECQLVLGQLQAARDSFLKIRPASPSEKELVNLKLLLIDLRRDPANDVSALLPEWPPRSATGYAAYAALAHFRGGNEKCAALLGQAAAEFPEQWTLFLKKTLSESGVPVPLP